MPNHLYFILHFHKEDFNLNTIICKWKKIYSVGNYQLIGKKGTAKLLHRLKNLVRGREKKKGELLKVLKDSFDAKAMVTYRFLILKMNYIHNTSVSGK